MNKGFAWALGLVAAVNVFVLLGAHYNRSGTPDARLVLSERELPMAWTMGGFGAESENSGVRLRLDWQEIHNGPRVVFDRAKLETLGFRLVPQSDRNQHKRELEREAYGVFEFNGDAWLHLLEERRALMTNAMARAQTDEDKKHEQEGFDRFERHSSRLVLVDAGLDPKALRATYSDGGKFLIAKITVGVYASYVNFDAIETRNESVGSAQLLSSEIYVPPAYRERIDQPGKANPQRWQYEIDETNLAQYEVTLAYGRRYEPWIEDVVSK